MKPAYIVLADGDTRHAIRLINVLADGGCPVAFHYDRRSPSVEFDRVQAAFASRSSIIMLERIPCYWGDWSLVEVTLTGLRTLLAAGGAFDHVIRLSGRDYPIKSHEQIADFLQRNAGRQFMEAFAIPDQRWRGNGGLDRVHYRYSPREANIFGLHAARWHRRLSRALGWRRKVPEGLALYGGSALWGLSRSAVSWLFGWERFGELRRFYRHTLVPDEQFFQTALMNSPYADAVAGEDLHMIGWAKDDAHPRTLTVADLDRILRSDKLFARKFDPDASGALLDRLDEVLFPAR